jgi:hypothetical protein
MNPSEKRMTASERGLVGCFWCVDHEAILLRAARLLGECASSTEKQSSKATKNTELNILIVIPADVTQSCMRFVIFGR